MKIIGLFHFVCSGNLTCWCRWNKIIGISIKNARLLEGVSPTS